MGELARESILHALVAALVVSALTRTWRVDDSALRVRLGIVAMAGPAIIGPALHVVAPARATEGFRQAAALFDSTRWNDVRVLGAGLADVVVGLAAVAGALLLVRDMLPWIQDRLAARPAGSEEVLAGRARAALERAAGLMRIPTPPLAVLDEDAMVLQCAGVRRPSILISRGACAALDDAELETALAHELAHLERRDPALGWALMAARLVLWFNPVVHVVSRALTQELERRADERSATATGDGVALASALLKVFRGTDGADRAPRWPVPGLDTGGRAVTRFRAAALEARCRRLLDGAPAAAAGSRLGDVQVVLASVGVALLLFFVV